MKYAGVVVLATIFTLLLQIPGILAEENKWVTVEAAVPMTGSHEDARRMALDRVRQSAIASAVGADLSFDDIYVRTRLGGTMAHAIPHGEIIQSEILSERTTMMTGVNSPMTGGDFNIRFKAAVRKSKDGKNPAFRVFAALNKSAFVDGDEMQLYIEATTDCYLMAFVLLEDQRVLRLIPSALDHDTFLDAGDRLEFPAAEDLKRGIRLQAHLAETNRLIHEAIYVLALKKNYSTLAGDIKEGIFSLYDGSTAQIQSLVGQVAPIPPDQRAEALVYYQIRPKS